MSLSIKEIQLAVGDPGSDAWLEVHHAANRAVWGDAAQRTSIEEVVDVTARRHEVRRTFVAEDASSRIHEHSGAPVEHGNAATEFALVNGFRQTLLDLRQDLALPVSEETLA